MHQREVFDIEADDVGSGGPYTLDGFAAALRDLSPYAVRLNRVSDLTQDERRVMGDERKGGWPWAARMEAPGGHSLAFAIVQGSRLFNISSTSWLFLKWDVPSGG